MDRTGPAQTCLGKQACTRDVECRQASFSKMGPLCSSREMVVEATEYSDLLSCWPVALQKKLTRTVLAAYSDCISLFPTVQHVPPRIAAQTGWIP